MCKEGWEDIDSPATGIFTESVEVERREEEAKKV
jgi:hypothetical protein